MKKAEFYEFDLWAMNPTNQEVHKSICTIDVSKIVGFYPTVSQKGETIGTTLVLEGNVNIPVVFDYNEAKEFLQDVIGIGISDVKGQDKDIDV